MNKIKKKNFKIICISLLGLFLLLFSKMVGAVCYTASSQLSQFLDFHTYQADFKQTTCDSHQNRVIQHSQGRMMIIRPSCFRWEIESPAKQFIIINEHSLWMYDVDLCEVTQQSLAQEMNINPIFFLLRSAKNLNQQFIITVSSTVNSVTFQLVPTFKKNLDFNWICLKFSKKNLTKITLLNNLDEKNVFQFSKIKVNAPLSNTLFELKSLGCCDVIKQ